MVKSFYFSEPQILLLKQENVELVSVCIPDGAAYPQTGDGERSWFSKLLQVTVLEEEQVLSVNLVSQVPSSLM